MLFLCSPHVSSTEVSLALRRLSRLARFFDIFQVTKQKLVVLSNLSLFPKVEVAKGTTCRSVRDMLYSLNNTFLVICLQQQILHRLQTHEFERDIIQTQFDLNNMAPT